MSDVGQAEKVGEAETFTSNRDRVRKMLFEPLGFRCAKKSEQADQAAAQSKLADELAYLEDWELDALRAMVEPLGQGKARDIWPEVSTFRGFAQIVRPRPLVELPSLRRWFASREGPRAMQDGFLVETADFFERRRKPPVEHGEILIVVEWARQNSRRLERIADREKNGWSISDEDRAWRRRYLDRRSELEKLVKDLAEEKAKARGVMV